MSFFIYNQIAFQSDLMRLVLYVAMSILRSDLMHGTKWNVATDRHRTKAYVEGGSAANKFRGQTERKIYSLSQTCHFLISFLLSSFSLLLSLYSFNFLIISSFPSGNFASSGKGLVLCVALMTVLFSRFCSI